jgi:hypothetical protein
MKSEIERLNFVIWAKDRFPGFTTNHLQYTKANRAWRAVARKDPMIDKVIRTCYNKATVNNKERTYAIL